MLACSSLLPPPLPLLLPWRRKLASMPSLPLPLPASFSAAMKGEGLFEGLDWLSNTLKTKRR
jgi:hypothetical protein